VSSVRRIVIKHSKSIEETAAVFSRYLKMVVEDPRYSRPLLGIPGILLIVLVVLSFYNLLGLTWLVFLVILGGALLIKGFGVDRAVKSAVKWAKDYEPPPVPVQIASFATAAGLLSVAIGIYLGLSEVSQRLIAFPTLGEMPSLLGEFIQYAAVLIFIGICVVLSGRAIKWYFEHDARLLRTVVIIAVAAWSSQIALQVSQILINPSSEYTGLVVSILVGILVGLSSLLAAFLVHRRYAGFFRKKGVEVEEFNEET
jgi:putative membrane protein